MKRIILFVALFYLLVGARQAWAAGPTALQAAPGLPSTFYGCVRFQGASVPAGSYVTANINGVTYRRVPVSQMAGMGTVYTLDVPADNPDTPQIEGGKQGDRVAFIVELPGGATRAMRQVGTWRSGSPMELNLETSVNAVLPLVLSRR